jgi:hypothetical protein
MNMANGPPLPYGAKKLDLQEAVLTFLDDKLVFAVKGSKEHLTIHFGPNTKKLDVHRTRRTAGGNEEHETLFRLPHDQLARLLGAAGNDLLTTVGSLFRPLRIGWMARHRIGAEPAFFPVESELEKISTVRKKRLHVDEAKLLERLGKLNYLEDLLDLPDGRAFSVISCKNPFALKVIGFGIKTSNPAGRPRLLWCSNRRLGKELTTLIERLMPQFKEAMKKNVATEHDGLHVGWIPRGSI